MIKKNHSDANIRESEDYIPGRNLWGAFAAIYRQKNPDKNLDEDENFYDLFLSGKVRFGNCYLKNSIPVPLSLYECSSHQHGHFKQDCLVDQPEIWKCQNQENGIICGLPLKPLSGYMGYDNPIDNLKIQNPLTELRMRNHLAYQSFTTGEGGLFTDMVISAQNDFKGIISFQEEKKRKEFIDIFKEELKGGKSLYIGADRDIYGKIKLRFSQETELFVGKSFEERWKNSSNGKLSFSLTLLSDTIVTDDWLGTPSRLEPDLLKEWTGLKGELRLESWFSRIQPIHSFSNVHQMPREEDQALSKGSAFLYSYKPSGSEAPNLLHDKLKQLEQDGIGFRLAEGFGQIAINLPIHWKKP
ncbi:MAG: hypothetical protein HUU50_00635 [Candidatus Brocadiae bacterium]|nr:hypothetical protein [Candidatus Brocadiia bacterium]